MHRKMGTWEARVHRAILIIKDLVFFMATNARFMRTITIQSSFGEMIKWKSFWETTEPFMAHNHSQDLFTKEALDIHREK